MNYEEMSDFEINGLVSDIVRKLGRLKGSDPYHADISLSWDYCNNPSDAWPIVNTMITDGCVVQLLESGVIVTLQGGGRLQSMGVNPLRAAMIVFLKMKETV